MRLLFNLFIFLITLIFFGDKSLSLSDYEIKKICKKEKRNSTCKKILQEKKYKLEKGYIIKIPVIPYRR